MYIYMYIYIPVYKYIYIYMYTHSKCVHVTNYIHLQYCRVPCNFHEAPSPTVASPASMRLHCCRPCGGCTMCTRPGSPAQGHNNNA